MPSKPTDLPRGDEAGLLRAIEMIYEAATTPSEWPIVLEALARRTHSELASLALHDVRASVRSVLWWYNVDPALVAEDEAWAPKNPFIAASGSLIRTGWVCSSEDVLPSTRAMRTEYFNEYLRRLGVVSHIGACIVRDSDAASFLFLPRQIGRNGASRREVEFIQALMPHFARAMAIHRRLEGLSIASEASRQLLDRLPAGILLLDGRGHVLFMNGAAESLLKSGDGLALTADGQLTPCGADQRSAMAKLIREACDTGQRSGVMPGGTMLIRRPSGRRGLPVLVTPLRVQEGGTSAGTPAAAVFATDPESEAEDPRALLQQLYGLTRAESRVAWLLFQGQRVAEICEQLSITEETARSHVKRILSKAECRSQTELIRVLCRGPAAIRVARS